VREFVLSATCLILVAELSACGGTQPASTSPSTTAPTFTTTTSAGCPPVTSELGLKGQPVRVTGHKDANGNCVVVVP
jgi:hypothetical protein